MVMYWMSVTCTCKLKNTTRSAAFDYQVTKSQEAVFPANIQNWVNNNHEYQHVCYHKRNYFVCETHDKPK